jgi:hypothetical protein
MLHVKILDTENNTLTIGVHAISLRGQIEAIWLPSSKDQILQLRVDSLTLEIWLPVDACTMFEEVFGLIWNSTLEYYFIDDSTRSTWLDFNPSFTFSRLDWMGVYPAHQ